jgi:acetyl-CoA carboxylase biotin carboxyl carrier protein
MRTGGSEGRPIEDGMTKNDRDADIAFIDAMARLLRENDLTEIEVKREYGEDDTLELRVSRAAPVPAPMPPAAALSIMPPVSMPAPEQPAPEQAGDWGGAAGDPSSHPGAVASPMVGTVYLQAEPSSPPFVSVGDSVEEGATLLIIEAMKTMNQIPAPRAGVVRRILVEDGAPVEYGAPLVILD